MPNTNREPVALPIEWRKAKAIVVCADLGGFFPLARKSSLDDLGGVLQQLYSIWTSEVIRQKGEPATFVGDSMLAIFRTDGCGGADPEWCATLTAFHAVKLLRRWREDIDLNIGINAGEFLEGRWESQGRNHLVLCGDTVNRAATLGAGKVRGIMASRPVVDVLGPRVAHERLPMRFPGSDVEEPVYRLTALKL